MPYHHDTRLVEAQSGLEDALQHRLEGGQLRVQLMMSEVSDGRGMYD